MTGPVKRVMVDLETLDSGNNALILSIGAVEFSTETGLGREFYGVALQKDQEELWDRTVSPETVTWWSQQSPEARFVLADPAAVRLDQLLQEFRVWFGGDGQVWGYGSTFDNVVLRNAFKATNIECPWGYRSDMCHRTLLNLAKGLVEVPKREGTHHNALDDARYQAICANIYLTRLGVA